MFDISLKVNVLVKLLKARFEPMTKQNQIKSCDEHEHLNLVLNQLSYRLCHVLLTNFPVKTSKELLLECLSDFWHVGMFAIVW